MLPAARATDVTSQRAASKRPHAPKNSRSSVLPENVPRLAAIFYICKTAQNIILNCKNFIENRGELFYNYSVIVHLHMMYLR